MSDVDKIMNPLHFGSDPAGIQVRIRINLENCIPIPDHFCLMLLLGALAEVCAVRSRRHLGQHSPRFCRTACLLRRSLQLRICIHDDRPISSQCHCQVAYADDTSMPIIRIAASRDHAAYRTVGSSKWTTGIVHLLLWANSNNLKRNRSKSKEIVCRQDLDLVNTDLPPPIVQGF